MSNPTPNCIESNTMKDTQLNTGLEESIKGSGFIFDWVNLLHYKCHKRSVNRGESHIDFPKCLKNKKASTNPTKMMKNVFNMLYQLC